MKKGITLIELIISVTLFLILGSVVLWVFVVGLRSWDSGLNRANIRQSVNVALERMTRELGQASEVTQAKAGNITFQADLDENGTVETITFDVTNADNLERTESGRDILMVSNVQDFTLGYYLESGNDTLLSSVNSPANRDTIRVVVISITVSEGDETLTFSTSAYTRNQSND
ncbi:MAG: hypothetical protein HQ549_03070 [Candidatus Omnitrophica bacterium]|nr:hypothetical protein [Candidatus Omnitrophota bacterium]